MKSFEWFIARRYLFSGQREALEWFVTIVSILGVAVGVGTMIAVVGVMDGMREQVINDLVSFESHVSIFNEAWRETDPDPALLERLRSHPNVAAAEPHFQMGGAVYIGEGERRGSFGARIRGVDRLGPGNIYHVQIASEAEAIELEPGQILIGDHESTKSLVGTRATVVSQSVVKTVLFPIPKTMHFDVAGTFTTGNQWWDRHGAFISREDFRKLNLGKGSGYIQLMLKDPMAADTVRLEIEGNLPEGCRVYSWTESFSRMFSQMRVLKWGMMLVMLMTMLVAALNIIGTLVLIVIQKTREIGILKAMGATERLVARIFLAEGVLIGLVGSAFGLVLGLGFCAILKIFQIPVPGEWREFKYIPVQIDPFMVLIILVVSVIICTVAAFAPARKAARMDPVQALKYE